MRRSQSWQRLKAESGAALVVVMALGMAMLVLITMALTTAVSGMQASARSEDSAAALAAAYAGVDEYASRLSNDSTYQKYGNPAAPFTQLTGSAPTTQLPHSSQENPAFGIGEAGTWAEIAGTDGRAQFRYEVDNSAYTSYGTLRVRSTGKVGNATRSIIADLKQSGFIDFLYYTDYEIIDPTVLNPSCDVRYGYLSGSTITHGSNCTEIQFAASDTLDGPVHSNDILKMCETVFLGKVTTSSTIPRDPLFNNVAGCSSPTFALGPPEYKLPILPPPTNDQMSLEARADIPEVPRPGCMYTGPTQIQFHNNGTMTVVSPWTKYTNPSLTAGIPSQNPEARCGSISALQSSGGATVPVPAQNLIWVQTVPVNPDDDNYWASGDRPSNFTCDNPGRSDEGWRFHSHRYPLANEFIPVTSSSAAPAYGCRNGDAYVKGVLEGQVTVASQNFIYVTGDITYKDPAIDMLGLVGNNAVWVWNPVEHRTGAQTGWKLLSNNNYFREMLSDYNRTIDAAILSVNHTFIVQNYDRGNQRGLLHVMGAIAQKFRGPVATTGGTGYDKLYEYHERLYAVSPPKFLTPTSTTYGVTQYAETPPAFDATGAVP